MRQTCTYLLLLLVVFGCKSQPEACFTVEQETHLAPRVPLQFNDCALEAEEYFWEFGDGETSTDVNPQHSYLWPGDYYPKQTVTKDGESNGGARLIHVDWPTFEKIVITSLPPTKPNGDPWDPDMSGPDVKVWMSNSQVMPFGSFHVSDVIENLQTKLPMEYDLSDRDIKTFGYTWYVFLEDHNADFDTISWFGIDNNDMGNNAVWVRNFPNGLGIEIHTSVR